MKKIGIFILIALILIVLSLLFNSCNKTEYSIPQKDTIYIRDTITLSNKNPPCYRIYLRCITSKSLDGNGTFVAPLFDYWYPYQNDTSFDINYDSGYNHINNYYTILRYPAFYSDSCTPILRNLFMNSSIDSQWIRRIN